MTVHRPGWPLAPFVQGIWCWSDDLPDARERRLPTGEMQLVVNLAEDELRWYDGPDLDRPGRTHGAGLCSALSGPVGIDTAEQRHVLGVSFRPGGTLPFFGPPADALVDPVIGLDALWGRAGRQVRERLLEQPDPAAMLVEMGRILLEQVVRPLRPDRGLTAAVLALDRGRPVHRVVDLVGTTPSTLARRFRHGIGLGPKPFARVRRLQRMLGACGPGVDWAELAVRHGFFDQAHLIHDFRDLTGLTPTAYAPRSRTEPNHVPG